MDWGNILGSIAAGWWVTVGIIFMIWVSWRIWRETT